MWRWVNCLVDFLCQLNSYGAYITLSYLPIPCCLFKFVFKTPGTNIPLKTDIIFSLAHKYYTLEAGGKLNVHKNLRKRQGRFLNVLFSFNLRPLFKGYTTFWHTQISQTVELISTRKTWKKLWVTSSWMISKKKKKLKCGVCPYFMLKISFILIGDALSLLTDILVNVTILLVLPVFTFSPSYVTS